MKSLVRTYIERGGFEMQINVTDRRILEAARENPELYSDLVVRIGGYSDYFTRLSAEMQQEVILRTEHTI
jgi:formate C-acetyltransferase